MFLKGNPLDEELLRVARLIFLNGVASVSNDCHLKQFMSEGEAVDKLKDAFREYGKALDNESYRDFKCV